MKRLLMLALLAGATVFATSSDAQAHDYWTRGRSRSSFSISFGSPYGGLSYSRGYAPIRSRSFTRVTPNRYINRNYYSGPSYGGYYSVPSYGYGGLGGYRGYGCGW